MDDEGLADAETANPFRLPRFPASRSGERAMICPGPERHQNRLRLPHNLLPGGLDDPLVEQPERSIFGDHHPHPPVGRQEFMHEGVQGGQLFGGHIPGMARIAERTLLQRKEEFTERRADLHGLLLAHADLLGRRRVWYTASDIRPCPSGGRTMPANSTMPGTYALSFSGFNHDSSSRARFVAGVGQLVFAATEDGKGTVRGTHRATNSPMAGQQADLHYSEYAFSGTYQVIEAGPPIQATINMMLTQTKGGNTRMSDTFAMVQSGPDRFRLI